MSAGTVVIAGGILAAVILLTIVAVLCICRLQYYCGKGGESEKEEEEEEEGEEQRLVDMYPPLPLALPPPPTPPIQDHYSDRTESDIYPPTFLTEPDGPASPSPLFPPPPPPPPPPRRRQRPRGFCPSCTHRALPFHLQHSEHLCNGARGDVLYQSVQQGEPEPPFHLDAFHNKLGFWHSSSPTHSLPHSFSTDV
ncbi:unnamed protein product [Boreogadus saida]